ncbi:hypothetical protein AV521_43790 [Streptomyces sp. IMTB 2501]|uniref:Stk1 family PASTA domain-containing Ser/Thr kinase n=1 Tax=Streptomyces sp. IMTB 2501 TaxID=1776340 RepID=UPI00096CDF93|nr:Stk1 family PASTA domain-containing Ser/Thr kinase [Streptomyces sp. IMTB 2501]OLZ61258.1 hypothetical protein AV521_43790 [Streptomyces sp. IMTB 2501]
MRADIEACLDGQPVGATAALGAVGYGGYPDDQPTTALRPDAGGGATTMLPPMNPDDGGYGYDDGPGRRGRQQKKSHTSTILLVVAGILVLIGAILIGKWVASGGNTADKPFDAPNFVGQTYGDAQKMAVNADLKLGAPTRKPCDNQPKGNVCSQDPTAGSKVKKGDTINLVVSTGAPNVDVPDVRGLQFDQAQSQLTDKGFKVEKQTQESTQPPGVVISQDPEGGSSKQKGTTITLTVAKAADKVTIPGDLVGKSCDDAKSELQNLGLAPGDCTETPTNNQAQDGKVLSTNPAAGQQVAKNTSVAINVGKFQGGGQTQGQVPNVTGQTLKQAEQILQQSGYTQITITGPNDEKARVIQQTPAAGTQADPSTTQIALTTLDIGGGGNGNGGGFLGGNNG